MISDKTATVVVWVVLAGWAANLTASIFQFHGYQSNESVNAVFTGTVGVAFYARAKAKEREQEREQERKRKRDREKDADT
jgi:uncharacterized membrane protein